MNKQDKVKGQKNQIEYIKNNLDKLNKIDVRFLYLEVETILTNQLITPLSVSDHSELDISELQAKYQ